MDIDSPELRRERSIQMRDQDDSSVHESWTGGYDDIEEDGIEKPRELSQHRFKEKSKSSRREDRDHRSKDREQSKTSHGSKNREKEAKDLEKDWLSGKDRKNDERAMQEKEKSLDKSRERDIDREKYKDRECDKDCKERGKEKERERDRDMDRDSERGREKEREKGRNRDKGKQREKEREKHKEQGKGRENDGDKLRNVVDKEKGKERTREKEREVDRDGERQSDKDKGSHKHWDEGHDRSKYLRKDDKSSVGTVDNQDLTKTDAGSHGSEDGIVTLKHQQIANAGDAGAHSSTSELEERIMKVREKRLKKKLEGGSEVLSWITKIRKLEEKSNAEREKALHLSKIFEEQDNMNAGGSDDDDIMQNASHDLAGVKVLHGLDKVLEGGSVVLTLKDQSILSDGGVNEEVDVLENVEIGIQKQRDDAYKAAKRRTGIYDDKFNDETGSERKILPQYDDPVVDEGVTLDAMGRFTGEAEKKLEELRRRIQGIPKSNNVEDLNDTGKVLSDYYTQEEMLQFKKPKKKKSLRKREKLDIDALEAEARSAGLGLGDLGSRSDGRRQALREEQERNDAEIRSSAYQSALAKADEASKALHLSQNSTTEKDEYDTPVIGDDDDDLWKSLDKARKLALKKQDEALTSNPLRKLALLVSSRAESKNSASAETPENKVILTEMELWSRQLDEEAQNPDAEDVFMEEDVAPNASKPEAKEDGGWSEVNESMEQETSENKKEEIVPEDTIHEVPVGKGLAGALKLLKERGSLKETIEWGGRNMDKKKSKLVGIHDDEGPKEIHLERTDEYGRILTPKEAFRLVSHKFHGKGPGKTKQEKRMRQYQEELKVKQMKNADTPSLSVERMKEAQAKLKTPYLVLSGHVKWGQTSDPRSGFASVEKDLPGGLTPMFGDKKVEYFLGKCRPEPGDAASEKKPKI